MCTGCRKCSILLLVKTNSSVNLSFPDAVRRMAWTHYCRTHMLSCRFQDQGSLCTAASLQHFQVAENMAALQCAEKELPLIDVMTTFDDCEFVCRRAASHDSQAMPDVIKLFLPHIALLIQDPLPELFSFYH